MNLRKLPVGLVTAAVTGTLLLTAGPASARVPAGLAAATKAHHQVYLLDCVGDRPRVKPEFIALACADYGIAIHKASWTHWGDRTATASGKLAVNDCTPNCADGTFHSEPAKVTVTSIKDRHGTYEYGRIRVVPDAPNRLHFAVWSYPIPG